MLSTPQPSPLPTEDPNAVILDRLLVRRYRILGTRFWVHDAWAPIDRYIPGGPFGTVTHANDRWWGRLGTERDRPPEIDALPARSDERISAVQAWHEERYQHAYALLLRAFPTAFYGQRSLGENTLTEQPADA